MLNNNFSKLVKLYHKHQAKQRRKYFLAILLLLFAGAILFWFMQRQDSKIENTTVQEQPTPVQVKDNTAIQTTPKPTPKQETVKKVAVATPVQKNMPTDIKKRTKDNSKEADTFQLKITQQKNFYNLLLDYKNKPSYQSAIKLAQFYFNEKDYKKTVKWAIEASKKDPSQAMSWILYAKAKKALGNTDVAKKALAIYLKHNASQEAKTLLDSF